MVLPIMAAVMRRDIGSRSKDERRTLLRTGRKARERQQYGKTGGHAPHGTDRPQPPQSRFPVRVPVLKQALHMLTFTPGHERSPGVERGRCYSRQTVNRTLKELLADGHRALDSNQLAEARAFFFEAVRGAALEADRPDLAEALCGLAQAERRIGNLTAASHQYDNAARLYRALGLQERLAYAIRQEADILRELCRTAEAEPLYLEASEIYRQLGLDIVKILD